MLMKRGDVKLLILCKRGETSRMPTAFKNLFLILAALKINVHIQNLEFYSKIILEENPRGHPKWVDRHLEKHCNTTKTH